MDGNRHKVVIIGGGFGGLHAAQQLRRADVDVTLLDRRNFHLFQPLLYQVATGTLSPADIASPLRYVLAKQKNARVLLAEATGVDVERRVVRLTSGEVPYDTLILATGASHNYFGHAAWEDVAPGLKTIEDATRIRRRILTAYEAAERATDPAAVAALLTFVVVGGGPTGVELAGALAEISRNTLRGEFRHVDPGLARILLIEGQPRVVGTFAPDLSESTKAALTKLGVEVRTGWSVTELRPGEVVLRQGAAADAKVETVATHTVLWAAGVQASPLGRLVAEATGATVDRAGRVVVEADCSVKGHPEIFVIGDLAAYLHQDGQLLPGVAQTAIQQGRYVADLIRARLSGRALGRAFRYRDLGNMATIGRGSAIVQKGRLRMYGFVAWLAWLFVHLMNLVEFENRVLVFLQWAWSFWTWNRSARLITGESAPPPPP